MSFKTIDEAKLYFNKTKRTAIVYNDSGFYIIEYKIIYIPFLHINCIGDIWINDNHLMLAFSSAEYYYKIFGFTIYTSSDSFNIYSKIIKTKFITFSDIKNIKMFFKWLFLSRKNELNYKNFDIIYNKELIEEKEYLESLKKELIINYNNFIKTHNTLI